ncbi:hypothetical protein KP509_39G048500 [Ceratopteris richardii]|uniref:Uncharacterized protein n=1 Tax=Ceratopteris richardii TaxID=49495 RepID=A0A8T2Q186_CERRI|nr:hypothetical protein KP509_39G048500 [Ceratopteris richardii]
MAGAAEKFTKARAATVGLQTTVKFPLICTSSEQRRLALAVILILQLQIAGVPTVAAIRAPSFDPYMDGEKLPVTWSPEKNMITRTMLAMEKRFKEYGALHLKSLWTSSLLGAPPAGVIPESNEHNRIQWRSEARENVDGDGIEKALETDSYHLDYSPPGYRPPTHN